MKPRACPFCAESPREIGLNTEHNCRFIGRVFCSIEQWNTRLRSQKPVKVGEHPELPLKTERSAAQKRRDDLILALASAELNEPVEAVTSPEARRHAAALKVIEMQAPNVLVAEIAMRAANYRTHFDSNPTSNALAKWWRISAAPMLKKFNRMSPTEQQKKMLEDARNKERNDLAKQFGLPPTK